MVNISILAGIAISRVCDQKFSYVLLAKWNNSWLDLSWSNCFISNPWDLGNSDGEKEKINQGEPVK